MLIEFFIHAMHIGNQTLILLPIFINNRLKCLGIGANLLLILLIPLNKIFELFNLFPLFFDYGQMVPLLHCVKGCQLGHVTLKFLLEQHDFV